MKFKFNLNVRNKLFAGFGAVIFIMMGISVNTFFGLKDIEVVEDRLLHLRFPTVLAGAQLENGINHSLAALRGYMILGSDPKKAEIMKESRMTAWKDIDDAMAQMRDFSKNWTNPKNIENLKKMAGFVEAFRKAQQEVEDISHTSEEVPAFKTLLTEAAPRAKRILSVISTLIDEEATLKATSDRKKLLKLMADSRGSFAIGLANIRAFLLTGDTKFREIFDAKWKINEERFEQISLMANLMSASQQKNWKEYTTIRAEFAQFPPVMFKQRSGEDWNMANYWLGTKAAPKAKAIMSILHKMRVNQNELEEIDKGLLESIIVSMELKMLAATIIGLVIGLSVAIFISRSINIPLQRVVSRAKEISSGDLTGKIIKTKGNDELTELTNSINEMGANLQDIIKQVSNSASELSVASEQLQVSAEKTNQGMENQSAETEQVATAMNQMSGTVQEVATSTGLASASTEKMDIAASQGESLVSNNMDNINQLAERIEDASQTINKLGEDVNSVDNIVAVINGIAEQTNLLALNAAIEAARAGEQGRGFAVVADEVRVLASRTQESTEEIRNMLERLKTGSGDAVKAMDESQQQAQNSVGRAKEAAEMISEINRSITSINDMNTQIATAAEEQSAVAEEMNRSIVKINVEAMSTLENTQETRTVALQVKGLSSKMQELVSRFKVA